MNTNQTGPGSTGGFFAAIRDMKIERSDDRWIAGVASGIGARWNLDPALARAIALVVVIFTGIGPLAYAVAWALLPDARSGRILAEELLAGKWDNAYIGVLAVPAVGLLWGGGWAVTGLPGQPWAWPFGFASTVLSVAIVAGTAVFIVNSVQRARAARQGYASSPHAQGPGPGTRWPSAAPTAAGAYPTATAPTFATSAPPPQQQPPASADPTARAATGRTPAAPPAAPDGPQYGPPAPPAAPVPPATVKAPKPRWRRVPGAVVAGVIGVMLIAVAAVIGAHQQGVISGDIVAIAAGTVLVIAGLTMLIAGLTGRKTSGLGWVIVLVLIVAGPLSGWGQVRAGMEQARVTTFASSSYSPAHTGDVAGGFVFVASEGTVDLRDVDFGTETATTVPVRVVMSNVTILVPPGIAASLAGKTTMSDVVWESAAGEDDFLDADLSHGGTVTTPTAQAGSPVRLRIDISSTMSNITIKEKK
ncbi:PspC domain-containing protein [Rarobacter incanus]|uniref:Phage shock protein C (PspC) family protein n=1 Tax=Rarobacter incanus TaxID=153494 RepID=A0A542SRB2_9MICO|nr:PspC domain-containing protein [Rarobacter incanus]TQK77128.1 phage shock protein C (PspC) family protein [Rarobacter incanus]